MLCINIVWTCNAIRNYMFIYICTYIFFFVATGFSTLKFICIYEINTSGDPRSIYIHFYRAALSDGVFAEYVRSCGFGWQVDFDRDRAVDFGGLFQQLGITLNSDVADNQFYNIVQMKKHVFLRFVFSNLIRKRNRNYFRRAILV